jgi:hypothetical protein
MSDAVMYSNVSSEMTSMMGQTTVFLSWTIRERSGSSQPSVHSQWASRNVMTWPLTCFAPRRRALIRPERFSVRRTITGTGSVLTYSSNLRPRCSARHVKIFVKGTVRLCEPHRRQMVVGCWRQLGKWDSVADVSGTFAIRERFGRWLADWIILLGNVAGFWGFVYGCLRGCGTGQMLVKQVRTVEHVPRWGLLNTYYIIIIN